MPGRVSNSPRVNRPRPPKPAAAPGLDALLERAARTPRGPGPEGREPLLGKREVARARTALAKAPKPVRTKLVALASGFTGEGAAVASGLFLRAVAARGDRLGDARAVATLTSFAAAMKGQSSAQLRERATVLDLDSTRNTSGFDAQTMWERRGTIRAGRASDTQGDNDGLYQRFTASCGPTVIQMMVAEADPVVAFAINAAGRRSDSTTDVTAKFQRALLEEFGGIAVGRRESFTASRLKNALGRLEASGDVSSPGKEALLDWATARGPMNTRAAHALEVVRAKYGFPSDAELDRLRAEVLPARDEGLGTDGFRTALERYVGELTGLRFQQTKPEEGFGRGQAKKHLDDVERALERGVDVPFGVCEPAHWMLLTDVRGAKGSREFLVADPDGGRTAWVSEASLVSGKFGDAPFHLTTGDEKSYIDCFYLPTR